MDEEVAQPLLELVGLAEIAEILDVTKQRVQEIAMSDQLFPPPIARVSGGTLYMRSMIEAFAANRTRAPGRPVSMQARVSEELTHIPKDRQDPGQQALRMIYNIVRLHDLKADSSASRHQSLYLAIAQASRQYSFTPRYDTSYFQPEPPEQRYRTLHADCGAEHDTSIWDEV